jgi:hypothetical protein
MKPNILAAALAVGISLTAWAADSKVTNTEVDHARVYLQQTETLVVGATKGLSPAQWNFKPAPDRWSIAEILEHMVLAQDLISGPIRDQLAKAPAAGERDNRRVDQIVTTVMPDRTTKFQAPEVLQPTGRWTPAVAMGRLQKDYAQLLQFLDTTPDLRQHAVDAPPIKIASKGEYTSMDGYQWILTAAAHVERHTKQMLEVRADPNFPTK